MSGRTPSPELFILRPAELRDVPHLADLLGQLGYPASASEVAERLVRIRSSDLDAVIVADQDGRLLGFVALHLLSPLLHVPSALGRITALVVKEGFRGQGIGRALLREAETWAFDHGCARVEVASADHRDGAHLFYLACGYRDDSRRFIKTR